MSIRELDDGRVLLRCFAGCDVQTVLDAVDMDWENLYPPRALDPSQPTRYERKPWRAAEVISALRFEVLVGIVILQDLAKGRDVTEMDRWRAGVAALRMLRFMAELDNAH